MTAGKKEANISQTSSILRYLIKMPATTLSKNCLFNRVVVAIVVVVVVLVVVLSWGNHKFSMKEIKSFQRVNQNFLFKINSNISFCGNSGESK